MLIHYYQRLFLISLFYSGRSDHPLLAIYISKKPSKPITSPYVYIILFFLLFINKYLTFIYIFHKSKQHTSRRATCFCGNFLNSGFKYNRLSCRGFSASGNGYNDFSICAFLPPLLQCSRLRCPQ